MKEKEKMKTKRKAIAKLFALHANVKTVFFVEQGTLCDSAVTD